MKKLFENWRMYAEQEEASEENESDKTLLEDLEELLKTWPACDHDPKGMACEYHKDLEEVVKKHGGTGCGPGAHGEDTRENSNKNPATEPIKET